MKKTISLLIALVLSLSVSFSAMAAASLTVPEDWNAPGVVSTEDKSNCVMFVKHHFLPNLPSGLVNDAAKRAIVNSYEPREGSAVITNNGRHVAYCWGVGWYDQDGITRIAIIESNWGGSRITIRIGTPAELNVYGYWRP